MKKKSDTRETFVLVLRRFGMFRTSLLLIAISFASHECAIFFDGIDTGNAGGLRDWMRNIKDRMSNRESGRMSGLMSSLDLNNRPKMKLPSTVMSRIIGERMLQPVNLANVKFDPSLDRAYRMGSWYVIRRRSTNKDETSVDDWAEFFGDGKDTKWDVVNNGARVDASAKCILWKPTKSTSNEKESGEVEEELSAEVLNSELLKEMNV